ncbi:uncharacterized protein ISCGN_011293 [Ixodes scapularis]
MMHFALLGITALLGLHYSRASTAYLDQNPALQEYQDEASIFPLKETWYMAYRNFEFDPVFGGDAKCVRFKSNGPGADGTYPAVFQYAPDFSADATITPILSPGYTIENVLNFQAQGQAASVQGISAYTNVKKCTVFRLPYAGEGKCALVVPESKLDSIDTCCNFIFDLLCGNSLRFNISDSTCQ